MEIESKGDFIQDLSSTFEIFVAAKANSANKERTFQYKNFYSQNRFL